MNDTDLMMGLTDDVLDALEAKKIYFTFAYVGSVRCYKHNQLIWKADSPSHADLVERAQDAVRFFLKHGYIPNQEQPHG